MEKLCDGGRVVNKALVVAHGVHWSGRREILSIDVGEAEIEAFWTSFPRGLVKRGLVGGQLAISDSHVAVKAAIAKVLGCAWQRCTVDFLRDRFGHTRREQHGLLGALIRSIFSADSLAQARDRLSEAVAHHDGRLEKIAAMLEDAETDILAFYAFPRSHWRKLRAPPTRSSASSRSTVMKDPRAALAVRPRRAGDSALASNHSRREEDFMRYLGIDWGTRRAAWCALSPDGELTEGAISADEDGLVRLVARLGPEVGGCIEMMSGAPWVRDSLAACGWTIEIADARKVKAIAALACKTDRVDARVLADLARRELIATVWVAPIDDRAIRERLRRRSQLVRPRTSSMHRTFGLLTQWGLRRSVSALVQPGALAELSEHGVPQVWRDSRAVLLAVIDDLDRQLGPLERELRPLARDDERAKLLMSIPGVAELLARTIASEIGDIARFPSAGKLVGYSGLNPKIKQSGQSARVGRLSKAGPDTLRGAAVEAAQQAWRPNNPWHELYTDIKRRHGKANPAQAAVARKILIASGTSSIATSRSSPAPRARPILPRQAPPLIWPPRGPRTI